MDGGEGMRDGVRLSEHGPRGPNARRPVTHHPPPTTHYPLSTALFHWDNGLKLTRADLAIDFRRRQPRAFVSHAHSDHIARHEYALCTPETAALYQHRLGRRPTLPMRYREPMEWRGLRLTAFPAGHCFGSAMLLAEDGDHSALYRRFQAGRVGHCRTGGIAAGRVAGDRMHFRPSRLLPAAPRGSGRATADARASRLADEVVPVIQAYVLGKGQEVTRILTDAGIPVLQHRDIFAVSQVYESCGMNLGRYERFAGRAKPGWAVVVPPGEKKGSGPICAKHPEGRSGKLDLTPFFCCAHFALP